MGEIFEFSAHSLLNDALNHNILTLHYAECPEDVPMEMWEWPSRQQRGRLWRRSSRYNKHMSDARWSMSCAISISKDLRLSTLHYKFQEYEAQLPTIHKELLSVL